MDVAYDHIQEEAFPDEPEGASSSSSTTSTTTGTAAADGSNKPAHPQPTLNADLQDAYRAFSSSPWGAKIGGFFGSVVKQGESVYREAQQELTAVAQDATHGFEDLRTSIINRTRSLSLVTPAAGSDAAAHPAPATTSDSNNPETTPTTTTATRDISSSTAEESESETVLSRLREEAAKRLKDLQKAEDAADEALLRFGSNLRDFLRDAIKIAPPNSQNGDDNQGGSGSNAVLFESKDAHGKRVIHTSRFDAQLHVIHTTTDNFTKDAAAGSEHEIWSKEFDLDKKTEDISGDLLKYPELRTTMEKLVPDQVSYADFWRRYYFLRHGIETAEARRRDLLKAASAEEEVGGWDEDDSEDESTPAPNTTTTVPTVPKTTKTDRPGSTESSTTIHPPTAAIAQAQQTLLKPTAEPRKSNDEKSQADSDASYDVVGARSGVPSQAPNSPKESRKGEEDDSDEEDWE
ncbi:hypothetical protein B0T19DRAFT_142086 [Cercophora scortea]|uniref:BSD domain-containing protein n=1 Tax=Cercophora scortea TaxID=314031 RepID=A0AAE0J0L4_9PEZI|nr:hypothetical protein B0T19DRAFT_142086 [Cercophora scortea]